MINDDIKPKLDKFRNERSLLLELGSTKQSAQTMQQVYMCFLICHSKRVAHAMEEKLNDAQSKVNEIEAKIDNSKAKITEIDEDIANSIDKEEVRP